MPCGTELLFVRLTTSCPAVTESALGVKANAPPGSAAVATVRGLAAAPDCIGAEVLGAIEVAVPEEEEDELELDPHADTPNATTTANGMA
jgi:hypothetical protein